jgi:L-threonylcarbamoyladenylate synthase
MVLPKQPIIPEIVTAGLNTVAVRISAHPVFSELVRTFGKPLAAPSANRFGRPSPTDAQHALDELNGRIPLIVDGGRTQYGIESTIVAVRRGKIDLVRPGPITAEQLSSFAETQIVSSPERISAPGQLPSHYSPKTPLRLLDQANDFIPEQRQRVALLAWNLPPNRGSEAAASNQSSIKSRRSSTFTAVRQLSENRDPCEAAANLFRYLRELDRLNLDLIVAERVPPQGIGAAINDRLERAAAK